MWDNLLTKYMDIKQIKFEAKILRDMYSNGFKAKSYRDIFIRGFLKTFAPDKHTSIWKEMPFCDFFFITFKH